LRFSQYEFNFSTSAKVRAGLVLGRCHAALNQHVLAVAAFDAATKLAKSARLLLSEALCVKARLHVAQGMDKGAASGSYWDESTCDQLVTEMADRMLGDTDELAKALRK
jgi:hypothetical protein